MTLTGPATTVHPAESQKLLFAANYILILPLTPHHVHMSRQNLALFFYSFTLQLKAL
jgi:hypothetical protein